MAEAGLDLIEVAKNIRVIELDIIHDYQLRQVMNELRPLVEKRGVVFVAFDHKKLRIVEERALSEIFRKAADHVTRIESGNLHDPGQQRGRGRFSVRAGDYKIVATTEK